jgi:hypothetical protein
MMSKLPISIRIERILQEEASANVPDDINLWPHIREAAKRGGPLGSYESLIGETMQWEGGALGSPDSVSAQSQASIALKGRRKDVFLGIRRFRLNMAMALVALLSVAGLLIASIAGTGFQALLSHPEEGAFLAPGKVRHMIYTGTYTVDGVVQPSESKQEEFWLTEGKSHPLMRTQVTVPTTIMTWLDDHAYYEYEPNKGNQVRKYPYDPKYFAAVLPDPEIITKTLQMPDARLVGDDTLDGRPVVVITVSSSNAPSPPPPMKGASPYVATTVTYWIDRHTKQILQITMVNTTVGGPQDGLVRDKTLNKITLNELMDRSDLPADFFEFKLPPGATLVENPAFSTPTP